MHNEYNFILEKVKSLRESQKIWIERYSKKGIDVMKDVRKPRNNNFSYKKSVNFCDAAEKEEIWWV